METATCVIAINDNGKIWMGSDSLSMDRNTLKACLITDGKIFVRQGPDGTDWIFGITNSFRYAQILKHELTLREFDKEAKSNPEGFMVSKFILDYRACMEKNGFSLNDPKTAGSCLVGVGGNIFRINGDQSVQVSPHGYQALGCAEMIALGSLYSTSDKDPEERINIALRAAEEFSAGVRAPFVIKSI